MRRTSIKRGFADTPRGQIHYAMAGNGKPVLLLHQTPRSWDEYRDVLPILARKYWAIAMDTIGFGDSYKSGVKESIEEWAQGVINFLDAMKIESASIIGHHTGGVIAVEVAASFPEHVEKLVLSSTPYMDVAERERRKKKSPIDAVQVKGDGSHLTELWQRRMGFYPKNRPDLLTRFVIDALRVGEGVEAGHRAVNRYKMERKASLIKAPTLIIAGAKDPFSFPMMKVLSGHIRNSKTAIIKGGMVPMPDQMPQEFARVVMNFLDKVR